MLKHPEEMKTMMVNLVAKEIYFDLEDFYFSGIEVSREPGTVGSADVKLSYVMPNSSHDECSDEFVEVTFSYACCETNGTNISSISRDVAEVGLLCTGIGKICKSYGDVDDEENNKVELINDLKELIMKHSAKLGKDDEGEKIAVHLF